MELEQHALGVHDVAQDPSGRLWLATRSGIGCYDGRAWQTYTTDDGLMNNFYRWIRVDAQGLVWAATPFSGSA